MLTEHFVASIRAPDKAVGATGSKDVGVFIHELQPKAGLRQVFKKSATASNCLAVSESHVFAAQAEKAVIHVYNRGKGNHEATIPFNEKITCITLAVSDSVLILGTEGGRVMVWELSTGRLTSTTQSHLQAVTVLAVDSTSNYLLSGSLDSTVHAWSLPALLTFSNTSNAQVDLRSPIHSLSNHRGPITCLAVGHSRSQLDFAVSGSEDSSAVIWDYKSGSTLRTFLLQAVPRSLALDVSDRAFYTTYDEGSVQMVDLYSHSSTVSTLYDEDQSQIPIQPGLQHTWLAEGQELGVGMCLSLSWDGTRLLSGHKSGKIVSWDTSKGSFVTVVDTLLGSVSNLVTLPVQGFPQAVTKPCKIVEVVKPRMVSIESEGIVPGDYVVSAQFTSNLSGPRFSVLKTSGHGRKGVFQAALVHPSFPSSMLEAGIAELASGHRATSKPALSDTEGEDMHEEEDKAKKELEDLKAHNEHLKQLCAHLQKLQKVSFSQIREKTRIISGLVKEQQHLVEIAKADHGWEIQDINLDWSIYQQRLRNGEGDAPGKIRQESNSLEERDSEEDESNEYEDEETENDGHPMDLG